MPTVVIPAKAVIHGGCQEPSLWPQDSRFRGNDGTGIMAPKHKE